MGSLNAKVNTKQDLQAIANRNEFYLAKFEANWEHMRRGGTALVHTNNNADETLKSLPTFDAGRQM